MHPRGPDEGHRGPAQGPPSARSRDSLTGDLRRELADARVRLEEAGLRAEAHRMLGNHDAAVEATREQEDILADVEERLGRVVSTAVVQRDAEQVLAAAARLPMDVPRPVEAAHEPREVRPRTPALTGVASVLAVVAVSAAAIFGVTRGIDSVEVVGAAADAPTDDETSSSSPSPRQALQPPSVGAPGAPGVSSAQATSAPAPSDPANPSDPVAAATQPTASETETDDPDEAPDTELDQAVVDLLDAVGSLDEDGEGDDDGEPTPDPSESDDGLPESDADLSGQDLEGLFESPPPDDSDASTDGFVPGPPAQ